MSVRGRFLSGLVTVVMALAGFVTVGALPAAASPAVVQYVALGDSYAAGTALGSFPNCQRSPGYPAFLAFENRIQLQANLACSGATADDVANNQLGELNVDTRLVTLTVGAANLHLSDLLTVCTTRPLPDCLLAIQNVRDNLLPTLDSELTDLYPKVAVAAPRARIVVTGYPHLFELTADVHPAIIIGVNTAIDELNAAIRQAVSVTNDADVNIHYVDVTAEFAGHGIGCQCTDPFIHSLVDENNQPDPQAFHPTTDGYHAYADAISVALPGGWLKQLV
jgi:lysophospholipase L1-like esterase